MGYFRNAASRTIDRYGRLVSLTSTLGGVPTVQVRAMARYYRPQELAGGVIQGDRQLTVSVATLSVAGWGTVAPTNNDTVVIDGVTTAVQSVETTYEGDDAVSYVIQVRG